MKKTVHENRRVVVELGPKYTFMPCEQREGKEEISDYNEMVKQIKRHVENVGFITIKTDTKEICEFCEYEWETDPNDGSPVCCTKAVEEWEAAKATKE